MTLIARPLALVPDGPGGPAGPAGPGGPAGPVGPASPLAGGSLCPHASNRKAAEIIKSKRRINYLVPASEALLYVKAVSHPTVSVASCKRKPSVTTKLCASQAMAVGLVSTAILLIVLKFFCHNAHALRRSFKFPLVTLVHISLERTAHPRQYRDGLTTCM